MVALKGLGSGQLKDSKAFEALLNEYFKKNRLDLSLKLRLGYEDQDEIFKIIEVANDFPVSELIIHPRTGKQLYKGEVKLNQFFQCLKLSRHSVVYNGDLVSLDSFNLFELQLPEISSIMIGRGCLSNPFLPEELKTGEAINHSIKQHRMIGFHKTIFELYQETEDRSNVLNKMKQFWMYYSHLFKEPARVKKRIKKLKSIGDYEHAVTELMVKSI